MVHGLVLVADDAKAFLTICTNLPLVAEAYVVLDVLAGHADVVGDLVNLIALFGAGQDAGAAQPVNSRVVGVFGVDVPFVFLDLRRDPLLPAVAKLHTLGVSASQRP
jgi:hypothetical protein